MNQQNQLQPTQTVQPTILYFGTPTVLLNTLNEDGTTNITPMSSAWSLGKCLVLGLGMGSKGLENLQRHPECVVNLPDPSLWKNVEALAPLTGLNPVPSHKRAKFVYEKDKFTASGLTPADSVSVKPQRISECPLQIEAKVADIRIPDHSPFAIVEVLSVHIHAHQKIVLDQHHINPRTWSPLIYNFRHYFGLGDELGKTFRATT
jgi:flavin reductase (DIM6/NTAB) family NADH-FMN oxidoreductase RutF